MTVTAEYIDETAQAYLQYVTEQKAREKTQLEFTGVIYKENMVEFLMNPRFIPEQDLDEHHKDAIQTCLAAVSQVRPLNDKQIIKIKEYLTPIYEEYKKTNYQKLTSKSPAIGLDLGTTYCCEAYFNKDLDEVEIIPNEVNENTTPSYVQFNEEDDDIVVGMTAKDTAYLHPKSTIFDIKRMCGRHFEDAQIQKLKTYWPFQILAAEDGKIEIKLKKQILLPEQVLVNLVAHFKKRADEYFNDNAINVVVTVPAYFNRRQKVLTHEACNKAGLNVIRFISEPAAAAVAYGVHLQNQSGKRKGLIFDLGGGTFDVAILELENKKIKILATDGDPYLGGEDFDNSLIQHCVDTFKGKHGVDLMKVGSDAKRSIDLKRLKIECEKQKRFLSSAGKATISMDAVYGSELLVVTVTRDTFSKLIKPNVDKCMKVVDQILAKCQMKEADIDDVMLVGGSTRIPYVQERLSEKFGGKHLMKKIKQEEAVARGAAIVAYNIENKLDVIVQELDPRF